jgi:hypothetical protein
MYYMIVQGVLHGRDIWHWFRVMGKSRETQLG